MSWLRHVALVAALCGCLAWIQWQKREIVYYESVMAAIDQYAQITRDKHTQDMAILKKRNGELSYLLAKSKKRVLDASDRASIQSATYDGLLANRLPSGSSEAPSPIGCPPAVAGFERGKKCKD